MQFIGDDHNAFLAMYLHRLRRLVSSQCDALFDQHGIRAPSHGTSVLLYLKDRKRASIVELATELNYSHQLMNQRLKVLEKRGFLRRLSDPTDGRKVLFGLTRKGSGEARRIAAVLPIASAAMTDLFEELGVDLCSLSREACRLLQENSVLQRAEQAGRRKRSQSG